MRRESTKLDISTIPLELKYSSDYFKCACGSFCLPRYLETLQGKCKSRLAFLALKDYQLNIHSVEHGNPGLLLERVFIQSLQIQPRSVRNGSKRKCGFAIKVYRQTPDEAFTLYCRVRGDYERQEWQRALMISQERERKQVVEIIGMYLEMH